MLAGVGRQWWWSRAASWRWRTGRGHDGHMRDHFQQMVKWLASAADAARRPRGLVVLIYHRVGAHTQVSVDLPRPLFAEQLGALAVGWTPVALDQAVAFLEGSALPPGQPPVCLTFDDGTADFVEEALPEL